MPRTRRGDGFRPRFVCSCC